MDEPLPADAPVIPPVTDPIVHVKVAPGTLLFNTILAGAPVQTAVGLIVVTSGAGLTVTIIFEGVPGQELAIGVTI
jgi:hypothetical protein